MREKRQLQWEFLDISLIETSTIDSMFLCWYMLLGQILSNGCGAGGGAGGCGLMLVLDPLPRIIGTNSQDPTKYFLWSGIGAFHPKRISQQDLDFWLLGTFFDTLD